MTTTQHAWYNRTSLAAYPLVDGADREGIPESALLDASIALAPGQGTRVRLSSLRISPVLISATFVSDTGLPVGACSAALDQREIPIPLQGYSEGAGGFVVFGKPDANDTVRSWTPAEAWLLPHLVLACPDTDVPTVQIDFHEVLTGLVELTEGSGVEILAATEPYYSGVDYAESPRVQRIIGGAPRDAIIVRCAVSQETVNSVESLLGPCSRDPRFGTCTSNFIKSIAGVGPDANGNINVLFSGPFLSPTNPKVTATSSTGKIIVSYPYGISDLCEGDKEITFGEDDPDMCPEEEVP